MLMTSFSFVAGFVANFVAGFVAGFSENGAYLVPFAGLALFSLFSVVATKKLAQMKNNK
jgi:hypothetical protein